MSDVATADLAPEVVELLAKAGYGPDSLPYVTDERARELLAGDALILAATEDPALEDYPLELVDPWTAELVARVLDHAAHNGAGYGELLLGSLAQIPALAPVRDDLADWVRLAVSARIRDLDDRAAQRFLDQVRPLLFELGIIEQREIGGWQIYTMADAYQEMPPLEYVIEDLFSLPSLNIVYGAPGTFKSLLIADAALCVAAGRPWLVPLPGHNDVMPRGTMRAPVLWLDFDNGARRTNERFGALGRAHDIPPDVPFRYVVLPSPWLDAGNEETMALLTNHILASRARLVVIDNLERVSGDADENSAQMGQVMGAFRQVVERTGTAMVIIHHQRKATIGKSRAGDGLRGHSSIEAALDLALLVDREDRASHATISSTKVRGVDVWPFGAVFTYEHKPATAELLEARFYGVPVDDVISDIGVMQAVYKAVRETEGANKGQLKDEIKVRLPEIGLNRIGDIIDKMVGRGDLRLELGPHGSKCYYATDSQIHGPSQEQL